MSKSSSRHSSRHSSSKLSNRLSRRCYSNNNLCNSSSNNCNNNSSCKSWRNSKRRQRRRRLLRRRCSRAGPRRIRTRPRPTLQPTRQRRRLKAAPPRLRQQRLPRCDHRRPAQRPLHQAARTLPSTREPLHSRQPRPDRVGPSRPVATPARLPHNRCSHRAPRYRWLPTRQATRRPAATDRQARRQACARPKHRHEPLRLRLRLRLRQDYRRSTNRHRG